jgi:hypothetical protein
MVISGGNIKKKCCATNAFLWEKFRAVRFQAIFRIFSNKQKELNF